MIGRAAHGAWNVILIGAVIAFFAGAAVMGKAMGGGGAAVGQGVKGLFIFVTAVHSGFADADAVDAQVKAGEAEQRAKAAEKRLAEAQKKAAGKGGKP